MSLLEEGETQVLCALRPWCRCLCREVAWLCSRTGSCPEACPGSVPGSGGVNVGAGADAAFWSAYGYGFADSVLVQNAKYRVPRVPRYWSKRPAFLDPKQPQTPERSGTLYSDATYHKMTTYIRSIKEDNKSMGSSRSQSSPRTLRRKTTQ